MLLSTKEENRRYPKAKIRCPVIIKNGQGPMEGVTLYIGENTAFIQCSNPLRLNEVVDITIEVPLLNKPLETEAEVVWTNIYGPDDKITPRGMVVRYKSLDSGVHKRLLQVIELKGGKRPHTQDEDLQGVTIIDSQLEHQDEEDSEQS
jgi:hypothetical protein